MEEERTEEFNIYIETINVLVLGTGVQVLSSILFKNEMAQLPFEKYCTSSRSRKYRENLGKLLNLTSFGVADA